MRFRQRAINQKIAVSVVFVAAMFMSIMDVTIVNVALPTIGRDLHVRTTSVSGVSIGYLVALAVVIPLSGWMGDRFGPRRVMLASIVIFTLASALCGLATTFTELVAFRVLQGAGGGLLTPVGLAMLFRVFPPAERVRAASVLITPTVFAPALGPVLGGVLVTGLSWRWVFYVNLPIGALALMFGLAFLREQETPAPGRFDVAGFALSGVGLAALMYGVSEGPTGGWSSPRVDAALAAGALLLAVLVVHQLRARAPLLHLRLFSERLFRINNIIIFLATGGFLGVLYLLALFLQDGLGVSALESGLTTFPEAIGVLAGSQLASRQLYPRLGPRRTIFVGLIGTGGSIALMALVDARGELWWLRGLMFALGMSMGLVFLSSQASSFARIKAVDTGDASTLFSAVRQLGGAAGVAVLTTSLAVVGVSSRAPGSGTPDLHGYHVTLLVGACLSLAGALAALAVHDADADSTRVERLTPEQQFAAAG